MTILNDILSESNGTQFAGKVEKFLKGLDETVAEQLKEILRGAEVSTSAIQRAFRKNGFTCSHATLSRYRESLRDDR